MHVLCESLDAPHTHAFSTRVSVCTTRVHAYTARAYVRRLCAHAYSFSVLDWNTVHQFPYILLYIFTVNNSFLLFLK